MQILSLAVLFLISVIQVDVSLQDSSEIFNRLLCSNGNKLFKAVFGVLCDVKLNDSTFLVEEVEVLHLVAKDIINDGVIEWDVDLIEVDLFDSSLDIPLVLSVYCDLALISMRRGLLNAYLYTVLLLDPLDLRALMADHEPYKTLVDPHLSEDIRATSS